MQPIKEFMSELFNARIAEEKGILENRAAYRQKFFTPDCCWDNREFTLQMIESEHVVDIDTSHSESSVITEYQIPPYPSGAKAHRRRYHLEADGEHWLISHVEHECPVCHGHGDVGCPGCKGRHWK